MAELQITGLRPTVFFVRRGDALRHLARAAFRNGGGGVGAGAARLLVSGPDGEERIPLGPIPHGASGQDVLLPDIRTPGTVRVALEADGKVLAERTVPWKPQRHWEVYLVQYAHHDLGYTDLPGNVLREYHGFMDRVLSCCEETEAWPEEEARFRYLCEQTWSVLDYVENRPREVVERLAHFVRNGQIEITALFGNQTLELCGHEELIRLLYPAFALKRRFGVDIGSAEHNDIPGFVWGLAGVLAGAGVRYFSPGVPLWYFGEGEETVHPLWDTEKALPLGIPAACWWEGIDGSRVMLWSDLHGREWQPVDYGEAASELPGMLAGLEDRAYPYDLVSYTLRGGHRDNAPPTLRYAHMVREWNRRWAYPRLVNSTNRMFLERFERQYGEGLKTLRGDVPGTDYPVAATCTPRETAVDRRTHDRLAAAETFATLARLHARHDYPREILDDAYRETFYYDLHCWGMSDPGGPAQDAHWSEKAVRAYRAAALAHDVLFKATNRLADRIALPEEGYYAVLFNHLSFERSSPVRLPLHPWSPCSAPMFWQEAEGTADTAWPRYVTGRAAGRRPIDPPASLFEEPFEIVDAATGTSVPYQLSTVTDPRAPLPWAAERVALGAALDAKHVRDVVFVAEALPSVGYKTYRVSPCKKRPKFPVEHSLLDGGAGSVRGAENRFFELRLDPEDGSIQSLYDKELERELVDGEAPHGFGRLVVRASDAAEGEQARFVSADVAEDGPVFTTFRVQSEASCCPRIEEAMTLYHGWKRIDVSVRVLRDSTPMREVYVAFPFHVEEPRFRFEGPCSVVEPITDQWPGSCTDSYGAHHWVDVSNGEWGITWTALDAPMVMLGGLRPGYVSGAHHGVRGPGYGHPFLTEGELARGHIYSLISYNNFRTNFINAHPGEYLMSYSFCSHGGDWRGGGARVGDRGAAGNGQAGTDGGGAGRSRGAVRSGWSAANPPEPVWLKGPNAARGPGGPKTPREPAPRGAGSAPLPVEASFCSVDAPNVLALAFKQAEVGRGVILRLMEIEGRETEAVVTLPHAAIARVVETNLVEEDREVLAADAVAGDAHSVRVRLVPHSIKTLRLELAGNEAAGTEAAKNGS